MLIFFQPFAKLCKIFENILTAAAFTLEAHPGMQSDLSHDIPGSQYILNSMGIPLIAASNYPRSIEESDLLG